MQACQLLMGVHLHLLVRDVQLAEGDEVGVEPLAVGLGSSVLTLDLVIADQTSLLRVGKEHLAGTQAILADDLLRRDVDAARLGGEYQEAVRGHAVAGGTQAVAVEHGTHHLAVREEDGSGAVPRLHHGRIVLVEIALVL